MKKFYLKKNNKKLCIHGERHTASKKEESYYKKIIKDFDSFGYESVFMGKIAMPYLALTKILSIFKYKRSYKYESLISQISNIKISVPLEKNWPMPLGLKLFTFFFPLAFFMLFMSVFMPVLLPISIFIIIITVPFYNDNVIIVDRNINMAKNIDIMEGNKILIGVGEAHADHLSKIMVKNYGWEIMEDLI